MIWLLIIGGLLIGVGLAILVFCLVNKEADWADSIPLLLVGCIILGLTIGFTPKYNESYEKKICDIVSISRNGEVEGSFVLGCGHIDSKSYYVCYTIQDNGYMLKKYNTDTTYIVETDEMTPCVYECKESKTFKYTNVIYVPYNTIVTTFVLN